MDFCVVVPFAPNVVAPGYSDGQWSPTHEWHPWEQPAHRKYDEKAPGVQYCEYAHTRDADQGLARRVEEVVQMND